MRRCARRGYDVADAKLGKFWRIIPGLWSDDVLSDRQRDDRSADIALRIRYNSAAGSGETAHFPATKCSVLTQTGLAFFAVQHSSARLQCVFLKRVYRIFPW